MFLITASHSVPWYTIHENGFSSTPQYAIHENHFLFCPALGSDPGCTLMMWQGDALCAGSSYGAGLLYRRPLRLLPQRPAGSSYDAGLLYRRLLRLLPRRSGWIVL